MTEKPKSKILSRQQELMRAFDFTYHDLAANREGRVTSSQKKKIMNRETYGWDMLALSLTIFFCIAATFIGGIFLIIESSLEGLKDNGVIIILGFLTLLCAPFIVGSFYARNKLAKFLHSDGVKTIQGITVVETDTRSFYGTVTIQGIQLQARREGLLRIKHLEPHIIHYLPKSKVIVSVEVIEA